MSNTQGIVHAHSRGNLKVDNWNGYDSRVKAWWWNGSSWQAVPVNAWNGNSYTLLNEGRYTTTWYANWSHTYRYLNKPESDWRHGTKRTYENGVDKGHWYAYQGWWSRDPNGRMGSLIGFDMNSIRSHLSGATIEKVELYLRNIHSYSYGGDQMPRRTGHLFHHNYHWEPDKITRLGAFPDNKKLGSWTWFRGASVQRNDAPVADKLDWGSGYGTGLLDWHKGYNQTIEGEWSSKKVWLVLPNWLGEGFRDGTVGGFGFFDANSGSEGSGYGYWCGAHLSVWQYDQIEINEIDGFNPDVSWQPQLRITYRKLNPS